MARDKERDTAKADDQCSPKCPQCGLEVAADAIRCPRCRAFLLRGCSGSCASCHAAGCSARKG